MASIATSRAHSEDSRQRLVLGVKTSTLCLGLIVLLAAFLNLYNLEAIGDGNLYYTAAVESMLQSWHNFFFVAAEPGGSVTVDKPPLGLWIEALSAALFGVSGAAVVLPNILAGLAGVIVLYFVIRKRHGDFAGLLAALVMAITPVAVATQRNNTMDGMLTCSLILAAWAFLKATESGQARHLWLAALLVGIGFNIKMLQVCLPLPAFFATYILGAPTKLGRKLLNLGLATIIILVTSLWWIAVVDLTPADERPYVGSTEENLMSELILSHNGLERLLGKVQQSSPNNARQAATASSSREQSASSRNTLPTQQNSDDSNGYSNSETGEKGWLRFWIAPLSAETSWLLPFALVGMAVLLLGSKVQWPIEAGHRSLVLWGGWLVTCLVFFSIADHFHAYYLTMLAPALGALVGISAARLWQWHQDGRRWAIVVLAIVIALTLAYQSFNATQFEVHTPWLTVGAVLLVAGAILAWLPTTKYRQQIGLAMLVLAMTLVPLNWSWLTNQSAQVGRITRAYQGAATRQSRDSQSNVSQSLLNYLEAHTADTRYLVAVQSALVGAPFVLETGRPVLYMGGFAGNTPVTTTKDLAQLVASGELRYVLSSGSSPGGRTRSELSKWITSHCSPVDDLDQSRHAQSSGTLYACSANP